MRSVSIALVLLFGTTAAIDSSADFQPTPSFSGHWVLTAIRPERPGYDQFWLGTEVTVTQESTRLVVNRLQPLPVREATFTLDRKESRNEYVVDGKKVIRDSRATLNGGALLISTDTTNPDGLRYLSNILRWSLDADGTLVVGDTEICGRGECPSVLTTLRFTRKE